MRVGLHGRLFFSHVVVMLVGLISFIVISRAASVHLFSSHLNQMASVGYAVHEIREELLFGFDTAWSGSTAWAIVIGGLTAVILSYWVASRITQPLMEMDRITHKFAAGNWAEPVPRSNIPELARLSSSFNRLALSLQDVEERRRDLIGDLTHELRTPLTIVRGYLEQSLADATALSPDTTHLLVRETRRLERLVNDLQELSKAEAGQLPLRLGAIALPSLFDKLLLRFESQIAEAGPQLGWQCDDGLAPVLADRDRLEQILVNLLGNAIKHTRQGQIALTAWEAGDQVWVAVQDTGSGMTSDELPHVFERFWRSSQTQNQFSAGTGIGLAITKRLVELQGGRIEVESVIGQGSTFRFSLPKA
ncbi:HAMP domain-containing histidine kinase [Nodosilinea sp. LEGE 07088]|uniref:sensor histidine kinase n=1 Tax=Nodosilinea sp. LEGE 07088 TaxID=2777968 RepID=UPI00188248B5|nr:HAMP domain-containing sensor histidine kinase [Nodosilinea sp. LEGE 07088]MBE9136001.1 HAMP domain-containing histidine kinase [Nodosilinea sp. LEGE 07088]